MEKSIKRLEKIIIRSLFTDNKAKEIILSTLTPEDFTYKETKDAFILAEKLDAEGKNIDPLIIFEGIAEKHPTADEWLIYDEEIYLESAFFQDYIKILKDKRLILKAKSELKKLNKILSENNIEDFLYRLEVLLETLTDFDNPESNLKEFNNDSLDYIHELEERVKNNEEITGLLTGFMKLDDILNGLKPGELITIAGRTGMGKSTLALQIAYNIAYAGRRVLYFHQEGNLTETNNRLISQVLEIPNEKIKKARLDNIELDRIRNFLASPIKLTFDFTPGVTIEHIRQTARKTKIKYGKLDLIIVDHLQFMEYPKANSDNSAIGKITKNLLRIAKRFNIPVILLSQLNRTADKENRPPRLSDLRDSGNIEQDSHIVMFIERGLHADPKARLEYNEGRLYIAKNRNGKAGVYTRLTFQPNFVKYIERH